MKIKNFLFFLLIISFISSCKKEDALPNVDSIAGLGGDTWVKGAIDKYIFDSLTVPYNSSVKYKYDQFELEYLNRTVVPIKEEKVIPVLSAMKRIWIDPYTAETNSNFFKKYGNKFFILTGSGSYDPATGASTLGLTSDDGNKILLTQLNYFSTKSMAGYKQSDSSILRLFFHVIHHEFAHVFAANVTYPFSFTQVGGNLYTSDWTNVSDFEAKSDGFISNYAQSQPGEDFPEMVSLMLLEGKSGFDKIINSINYTGTSVNGSTAAQAQSRLRQKEAIIVGYFKESWNIDFYSLQTRTRAALTAMIY